MKKIIKKFGNRWTAKWCVEWFEVLAVLIVTALIVIGGLYVN